LIHFYKRSLKMVKKADEILDELFTQIKDETVTTDSEEDSDDEEESEEESDDSSRERRKAKKKKKKHKKEKKKKKKKHHRESDSESEVEKVKIKKEKEDNSFWGGEKPYVEEKRAKRDEEKSDRSRRDEEKTKKDKRDYDRYSEREEGRERYDRTKFERSYDDERRPVDLGRVALPYPDERSSRDDKNGHSRSSYDRDKYTRDKDDKRDRDRDDRRDRDKDDRRERDKDDRRDRDKDDRRRGLDSERRSSREKESSGRSRYDRDRKDDKKDDKKKEERRKDKEEEKEGQDGFWDTKWDAMQLEKKIEKGEKKGRYYLNNKRFKDATDGKEGTPSLSPSPERLKKKKKKDDSESDTEEYKRMKKTKAIQNLEVEGDGLVTGAKADPSNYEYDKVTMMYRKKVVEPAPKDSDDSDDSGDSDDSSEKKEVEDDLMKEIEELEKEVEKKKEPEEEKVDGPKIDWGDSALGHLKTEEEVEKAKERKKAKKRKKDKGSDADVKVKEEGEVDSEDEKERKKKKKKRSRSKSRRRSYSRGRESKNRDSKGRDRDRDRKLDSRSREAWGLEPKRERSRSRGGGHDDRAKRSRSPYDRVKRERYDRSRSREKRRRRRSRSRSRSNRRDDSLEREREDRYERNKRRQEKFLRSKINKERLLEIAKKNAAKILKSGGDFMGIDEERLRAMKTGGSNLDELTKFCKELAKKGLEDKEKIDFLAESESESEDEFRHPFMVTEKALPNPITMLLGSGETRQAALPPAAKAVAKSQRMLEFPVSSGNAHRTKIEVTGEETLDPNARLAIEMKKDEEEMIKFHEQMEQEEKVAKIGTDVIPWQLSEHDKDIVVPNPVGKDLFNGGIKELDEVKAAEVEACRPKPTAPLALMGPDSGLGPTPKLSSDPDKVFEVTKGPVVDIGTIVSKRLNAQRKLQADPSDKEALKEMYEAQQQMESWASSKNKPGQFVGATGANILKQHELSNGLHAWAKRDQFDNAQRVRGGFGEFMLKKMGWEEGEGLGRHKQGEADPLTLDIKFDKKGLAAAEEDGRRGTGVVTLTGCKDLAGKHPVSALTELCSKRRWGPPVFEQAFDCGPPHKKQYVYKVIVNGRDFMANVAVDNKKKAKSNAAMVCLQVMGLVPKDPDNPV